MNCPSLSVEGLAVIEKLLPLVDDDFKGYLLCDRADFTARSGRVGEADRMFQDIFETMPDWHFGRYRYALEIFNIFIFCFSSVVAPGIPGLPS